jgi:hypothetical protein
MPSANADHAIRARIESFLAELSGFVRKAALDSVEEVLGGGARPMRSRGPGRRGARGPGRSRKTARPSQRIRRSAADLETIAARVLAHVRSNAGQRLEQIGKALEMETAVLKRPVADMLAGRKLRTKGQKRGTMYFAGGGRGGARKTKARRPAKRARRAKVQSRRPAKRTRKTARKPATKAQRSASRASDASAMLEQAERMAS